MTGRPILPLNIDRRRSASLQDQLYSSLREQIQTGQMAPGSVLPSSRDLAADLGVSRNTVIAAYDRLAGEGYLETRERSGIFVNPEFGRQKSAAPAARRAPLKPRHRIAVPDASTALREPQPFRLCQPDVRLFPLALWNRLRSRALRRTGHRLLNYQSTYALGLPVLRQALAEYLGESRGVRCDWTQVVITCGSQEALYLLSQVLLKPGQSVLLEDPGYPGAKSAFGRAGAVLQSLPVDELGAIPPEDAAGVSVIYTTPSRQFPSGACLPAARRMALIECARKAKAWLIEDDYDSEFRYSRPPLPAMYSLDRGQRVLYIGSMSKVLFPSLRIGYMVVPPELLPALEELRLTLNDHGPLIDQVTLADFLQSGAFYTHIRRCRKAYEARLDTLLTSVAKHSLPLTFPHTDGGMNQAGYFNDHRTSALRVSQRLRELGFEVPCLESYTQRPIAPGLVFGFTAFDPRTISRAVADIADVIRSKSL